MSRRTTTLSESIRIVAFLFLVGNVAAVVHAAVPRSEGISQPTVISVLPPTGPTTGGTNVTITGTNLNAFVVGNVVVTFGGAAATNVVVVNSTTITATTPAHAAGAVTVTVKDPDTSASLPNGFTYLAAVVGSVGGPTLSPLAMVILAVLLTISASFVMRR